jgi:HK97 family phage major capsid protein
MKKKYVKTEEGVFVLATPEQEADESTEKFEVETPDPPEAKGEDSVAELTGLIKEMAGSVNNIKEKAERNEATMKAYQEAAAKGFPIPGGEARVETTEEADSIYGRFQEWRQGKRLVDKFHHPTYQIPEEKRQELAKYFCLVVRAGYLQEPDARAKFRELYGEAASDEQLKTPLGDAGNIFPVPDIVDTEILHFAREKSVVLQYARMWDMTSEKQSFPQESAGASVGWGNTTPVGDPTIAEVELDAEELSSYSTVRNTTLADARSDIVSWLTETMAEAAGLELDNQGFNGDGTYFYGALSSQCGYSVVMTGSSFSDIDADVLSEMISKLDGLKKQGARFFMHGQIIHYVRILKDSNDHPIFIETVGAPMSGTIWGYPYSEVINMPSTTGANTAFVNFCNLRYLAVGRRLESTVLSVDPYGLFTTNRTRFKLYQRWALVLGLPLGFVRLLTGT